MVPVNPTPKPLAVAGEPHFSEEEAKTNLPPLPLFPVPVTTKHLSNVCII